MIAKEPEDGESGWEGSVAEPLSHEGADDLNKELTASVSRPPLVAD